MFSRFKYERIPLSLIKLDEKNPRIVTPTPLAGEDAIVRYFFEHENLADFMKKFAAQGRNQGAERPYVVKTGKEYTVIEGNTRIATYKLLSGLIAPPDEFAEQVPHVPPAFKEDLVSVDCTVAPSRDAMMPIMASAHFGLGDKSKWGYLGSRKAVYDEWKSGKSITQLASIFDRKQGAIRDLILEYELYLAALDFDWTPAEKAELLKPEVEFNPPVRFLQTTGHKSAIGVDLDRVNLAVVFRSSEARAQFRHLIYKLVIKAERGLGATASYKDVFSDYSAPKSQQGGSSGGTHTTSGGDDLGGAGAGTNGGESTGGGSTGGGEAGSTIPQPSPIYLFTYTPSTNNQLLAQLMREARKLNAKTFPASATSLLRSIIESALRNIIEDQNGNSQKKMLSLESAISICLSGDISLSADDKKILKELQRYHLDYINMGAHGSVIPNTLRLMGARDCLDQFIRRNV